MKNEGLTALFKGAGANALRARGSAMAQAVAIVFVYSLLLLPARRRSPPPTDAAWRSECGFALCTRASITRGEWVSGRVGE